MAITTLNDLRAHLQWAIELEHATIPPYLCALYSIKPGKNTDAAAAITSVFVEEMLHLTLAANVLNAIGGAPVIDAPSSWWFARRRWKRFGRPLQSSRSHGNGT